MKTNLEIKLGAGINYILEGRQTSLQGTKINKKHIAIYSGGDLGGAIKQIEAWQKQGILKILKNPLEASDDEACIEVYQFIDQKSPIKGWLNWN